jgi:hypothetical protein
LSTPTLKPMMTASLASASITSDSEMSPMLACKNFDLDFGDC